MVMDNATTLSFIVQHAAQHHDRTRPPILMKEKCGGAFFSDQRWWKIQSSGKRDESASTSTAVRGTATIASRSAATCCSLRSAALCSGWIRACGATCIWLSARVLYGVVCPLYAWLQWVSHSSLEQTVSSSLRSVAYPA